MAQWPPVAALHGMNWGLGFMGGPGFEALVFLVYRGSGFEAFGLEGGGS